MKIWKISSLAVWYLWGEGYWESINMLHHHCTSLMTEYCCNSVLQVPLKVPFLKINSKTRYSLSWNCLAFCSLCNPRQLVTAPHITVNLCTPVGFFSGTTATSRQNKQAMLEGMHVNKVCASASAFFIICQQLCISQNSTLNCLPASWKSSYLGELYNVLIPSMTLIFKERKKSYCTIQIRIR